MTGMITALLTAGALQLLALVAAVYLLAYLWMVYGSKASGLDVLLLALQALNLVVLLQWIVRGAGHRQLLLVAQGGFVLLQLARFLYLIRKIRAQRELLLFPQSIRETVDHLPGGLCFSTVGGKPILTNHLMNRLAYQLTGSTILNAQTTWEALCGLEQANRCTRLRDPWLKSEPSEGAAEAPLYFSLPDGRVWQFRREALTDRAPHYLQLEATDISELYRYSRELYDTNRRLTQQHRRQRSLLESIVDINHEREILSMKMRIHDALGRSILSTKQHLFQQTLECNLPQVTEIWSSTLRNLEDVTRMDTEADSSPEVELQKAADMIGCRIVFEGERPAGRRAALLLYAAVREALTNAVLHAKADQLLVRISPAGSGVYVEISDNGTARPSSLVEGGGLSNLRRRLEQEGATLHIRCQEGVVLAIELPDEEEHD